VRNSRLTFDMTHRRKYLELRALHEKRAVKSISDIVQNTILDNIIQEGFKYEGVVEGKRIYVKYEERIIYCPTHKQIIARYNPTRDGFKIYINPEERERHRRK